MKIIDTTIKDVKIIQPQLHGDERGYFLETFRENWFRKNIADLAFVQENQSLSSQGTLRGLHYQRKQTQGKLIRVTHGEIFDVAVDLRLGSVSYGKWVGVNLSAENKSQLWVPPGFAHGFLTLSEVAEITYKCTDYYHPQSEESLLWDDPTLDISWPETPKKLSEKDSTGRFFEALNPLEV